MVSINFFPNSEVSIYKTQFRGGGGGGKGVANLFNFAEHVPAFHLREEHALSERD